MRARQALEDRRARVVGVERLDRARAGHPRDVAEQHEHERERRQEQVLDLRRASPAPGGQRGRRPAARPATSRRTTISRTMPQTNSGIAVADRPPTEMTRSAGLPACSAANTPPRIAERHDDDERQHRELERVRQRRRARRDDRPLEGERACRGRRAGVADPVEYCGQQRLVGAELLVERVDRLGERTARGSPRPTLPGSTCVPKKTAR